MEKILLILHEIRTTKGQKITLKRTTIRLLKVMRDRRVKKFKTTKLRISPGR